MKFLERFRWYRVKHLRDYIPDDLKVVYDNINRGIPNDLESTLLVIGIVEKAKAGSISLPNKKIKD